MRPKNRFVAPELFQSRLEQILNLKHPLIMLSAKMDWFYFEKEFGAFYSENCGRSGAPIRLMVGLHYLKNAFDLSDVSNPEIQDPLGQKVAQTKSSYRASLWSSQIR